MVAPQTYKLSLSLYRLKTNTTSSNSSDITSYSIFTSKLSKIDKNISLLFSFKELTFVIFTGVIGLDTSIISISLFLTTYFSSKYN